MENTSVIDWICCVTDFFGIFFIISFAFYIPPNDVFEGTNPFKTIQIVWIYSILITIIPFALIGSIGMNMYWTWRLSGEYWCGFGFFCSVGMDRWIMYNHYVYDH